MRRTRIPFIKAKWGNDHVYHSTTDGPSRGVLTLISSRCSPTVIHEATDQNGQYHIILVNIRDSNYLLVNFYGNPDTDAAAYNTMTALRDTLEGIQQRFTIDNIVMGGDFNLVLSDQDSNSSSRKPRAEGQLLTILNTFDLFDSAALYSNNPKHTYFRHWREATSARYDRFYTTQNLVQGIKFKLLKRTGDHAPIEISTGDQEIRQNWKFSDSLLSDPAFIQRLHDNMRSTLVQYSDSQDVGLQDMQNHINLDINNSATIFGDIVEKVRTFCMTETKNIRIKAREEEKSAIANLINARNAITTITPSASQTEAYEAAQEKLQLIQSRRHQKASDRNLVNYASLGERTTRYHFARSKRGKSSREIPKLIIETDLGQRILEGTEVQHHMFQKYQNIVQLDPEACTTSIEEFLGPALIQSLRMCPPEHHRYLTAPILPIEIKNIVKELKLNSAPGPLGLSNSLIKEIVPLMTTILLDYGNNLFFGDTPDFMPWFFHRIVIFILKPGKPTSNPDSYRGISMLECFFKIFSKILSNRMQNSMLQVQNPHQFGFSKGKGILEASRTVLDVTQYAQKNNIPLIAISTDFFKAFDSIAIQHIENCLELYQFPQQFSAAFMRMARNGTAQFEINSQLSDDHPLHKGTGQGDPKSSSGYNLSAAPLNHYLANAVEVPRFKHQGEDVTPVFFADDALLLLQGDQIDAILDLLRKIADYYYVSGLKLNISKCEILAIGCNELDIERLIRVTGMKRVTTLKHLGIHIDNAGILPHEKNIIPLITVMDSIADSFNSSMSSPLGRSIYAKFLLSSKYLHRIQNFHFSPDQLDELRKSVLKLTWTRTRPNDDTHSARTHIAQDRVAQPLFYGGLSIPDPIVQTQSLAFAWSRKFCKPNHQLAWTRMLETYLSNLNRPTIQQHVTMGVTEWQSTAEGLATISTFWSGTFASIGNIIQLSHKFDKNWPLIPILGYEESPANNDISSLSSRNQPAFIIFQAGLRMVGQLFNVNDLGHVNHASIKSFQSLEDEFSVQIPVMIRNSISTLVRKIKQTFRSTINSTSQIFENTSTLQSLVRSRKTGCGPAGRLLLHQQRMSWDWGHFPRSFSTYSAEGATSLTASQFSKSLALS